MPCEGGSPEMQANPKIRRWKPLERTRTSATNINIIISMLIIRVHVSLAHLDIRATEDDKFDRPFRNTWTCGESAPKKYSGPGTRDAPAWYAHPFVTISFAQSRYLDHGSVVSDIRFFLS
eukprot:6306488-Pyramimonas_sp.AAC.2